MSDRSSQQVDESKHARQPSQHQGQGQGQGHGQRLGQAAIGVQHELPSLSFHHLSVIAQPRKQWYHSVASHFINMATPQSKTIINDVSGYIRPGKMTAIMGSSGAGKTTLLNALSFRLRTGEDAWEMRVEGDIRMAEKRVTQQDVVELMSYVPQQSVLLNTLTPNECVQFVGTLKLHPHVWSRQQIQQRTTSILRRLNLTSCANTRIGDELVRGLSGGEIKRVNIAVELVTEPKWLFLDEPTTGLDSHTAVHVIQTLKALTRAVEDGGDRDQSPPVTIIASIHQPSSALFHLFDDLLLLSHGRIVYHGRINDALNWMERWGYICPEQTSPPEFLLDLIQSQTPQDAARIDRLCRVQSQQHIQQIYDNAMAQHQDIHSEPEGHHEIDSDDGDPHIDSQIPSNIPYHHLLYYLTLRSWIHYSRIPLVRIGQLIQSLALAILIGTVFFALPTSQRGIQDRLGCIYFMLVCQSFANVLSVVLNFAEERAVLLREQSTGMYPLSAYFLGRSIVDVPLTLVLSFLFTVVVYFMIGFVATFSQFMSFFIIIVMLSFAGQGMGLVVSSAVSSRMLAMIIAPLAVAPFILFTPYALDKSIINPIFYPVLYASPYWWSFSALTFNEFHNLPLECAPEDLIQLPKMAGITVDTLCPFTLGDQILSRYHISSQSINFSLDILSLMMLAILYRLISYALLVRSARAVYVQT